MVNGSSLTISNDILYGCDYGIYFAGGTIDDGSSVTIHDNRIFDGDYGIYSVSIAGGSTLDIFDNVVYNNTIAGINIGTIDGNSTVIIGGDSFEDDSNIISENAKGIFISSCDNSTLTIKVTTLAAGTREEIPF